MTEGYRADRETVLKLLNAALATEIVCMLRYRRHHFMATGPEMSAAAAEFLVHANEEQGHANLLARRITQLNGGPNFNPEGLLARSHAEYVEGKTLADMIREDLVAERIAIDSYTEIIRYLGEDAFDHAAPARRHPGHGRGARRRHGGAAARDPSLRPDCAGALSVLAATVMKLLDEERLPMQQVANEVSTRQELEQQLSRIKAELHDSRRQQQLDRQAALHDPLTGLPNRILFNDRLTQALAHAQRHGNEFAVMFIDLDKFKAINDEQGHEVGDEVLKAVAQRLQAATRREDTVCRRSGDEFLFLMTGAQRLEATAVVVAKLLQAVAARSLVRDLELTVRCSIGIALYPRDGHTAQHLLENADAAMYVAKRKGCGSLFFHELPRRGSGRGEPLPKA